MRRLLLLLVATSFLLSSPAWAADDPRVSGAVAAWAHEPLYIDPDYTSIADGNEMLREITAAKVPVFVAVVPTGEWFPEKGDTALLAGRMAAANGKPGVYVVMDGDRTYGVANQVAAYAPSWTYPDGTETLSQQLRGYLDGVEQTTDSTPEPARTTPTPTPVPDSSYSDGDRFTVGKALANGLGGTALGLIGGGVLGGIVLIVAAIATPRRRKERS
ncbi:hypothetical protein GCM10009630_59930 [Kribbella jejuensis]|uniref:TLP18.3/Psb32/MOLO-1 phosphatase superfamily protein n=1 Tax=Kribbella jejuensis TaxID=236068 RepID=A0A542ETQ3_9ACTN|nr:hypothetical protein [Kribbella jejuensis]TQJ18705.1 hypothetical protein FB475_2854 [Kribbella jejuensis]